MRRFAQVALLPLMSAGAALSFRHFSRRSPMFLQGPQQPQRPYATTTLEEHQPPMPQFSPVHVTAATFDNEVIQSQQAICLLYYVNTPSCITFVENATKIAQHLTASTSVSWLKICLCNADKNQNLAAAFSIQRSKLPALFFIYAGTMVDRITGFVADDRLGSIMLKFKEYYEEQTGEQLGGPGSDNPIAVAKTANLADAAPTSIQQRTIAQSLIGRDTIDFVVPQLDGDTIEDDAEKTSETKTLFERILAAKRQATDSFNKVRTAAGVDTKRLPEEELKAKLFDQPDTISFAAICALEALFFARLNAAAKNRLPTIAQRKLATLLREIPTAASIPEVRRIVAFAELNLLRVGFFQSVPIEASLRQGVSTMKSFDELAGLFSSAQARECLATPAVVAEEDLELHESFGRWLMELDSRSASETIPMPVLEEALAAVKKALIASRRTKAPAAASRSIKGTAGVASSAMKRFNMARTFFVNALNIFPESEETRIMRSRLASSLY